MTAQSSEPVVHPQVVLDPPRLTDSQVDRVAALLRPHRHLLAREQPTKSKPA